MSDAIVFDPYDYAFQEDPYPTYRRCRDEDPLHHNEDLDLWVLTRHADVQHAIRTEGVFSNAMGVSIDKSAWGPDAHKVMSFLGMDPPRQQRLRSLVSKGFTPRRVTSLAPQIERLTDHYLTQCLEEGSVDWISDFAGKLPMDVISEMMGVPEADRAEVRRLADLVVHREPGVRDVPREGMEASLTLVGYYAEMIEQRKRQPTEDLTSALLAAELDGDKLTDEEIIAFLFLMVVAGNETTTKLLGHALFHLTHHPEQCELVFADPAVADDLVVPWVEETLRYDTSSQMVARHLLQDVELHGKVAPAGSKAVLVLGSANRDDRVFSDPDRYDVFRDKDEVAQLLSFGGGRHFCLGANLARLEARIALRELVRRVRHVEVDHDACVRVHSVNVRGFASVPVRMEGRTHPTKFVSSAALPRTTPRGPR
ncbi:cytochrome P450 [Nocardioides sp. T2.26MG-1]|uniref:cytochrome P450 n=1 Tax=Nocardioides sp. T2.26MG-1 TaxID=3041166 RepID=UPI0024775EAB|nr:cytochrome P450 [Nocardioides sp. T2.26MG-1]CAI9400608.1 Putative cytochrome P450 123 [Nocardioides sp. T2.26MG-1]